MKKHQFIEFTKASTRGQVVIPQDIREAMKIKDGSLFAIMQPKADIIIMKKVDAKVTGEDLELLKKAESAWEDIKAGRFKKHSREEFLKLMKSW